MAHQFFFNPFILDNLPAPSTGFDVVQDISEPRLRMYVTSRGVKTFFVRKRVHGRDRRIIIGNYPTVDIEDARNAVPQILENAMQKPRMHRKKITLKKFLEIYLEKRVRRNSTSRYKLERAIARHLTQILDKNMSDITRDDVAGVIEKIPGPAIASRMQEFLQSVFKYAVDSGYIKSNPLVGMVKIKQNRRVRPLNRAGFHRLMNAINNENDPNLRSAFLMLVYGFAPKSRVFSMQWCDLDFNHDTWCDMPLSDMAVVLLQDLPQDSIWVFPGRGRGHLTDPRIAWRRVANAAGIPNLTMDDVHKFLMRQVVWASDREDFRNNMNALLDDVLTQ
jgi:integrase